MTHYTHLCLPLWPPDLLYWFIMVLIIISITANGSSDSDYEGQRGRNGCFLSRQRGCAGVEHAPRHIPVSPHGAHYLPSGRKQPCYGEHFLLPLLRHGQVLPTVTQLESAERRKSISPAQSVQEAPLKNKAALCWLDSALRLSFFCQKPRGAAAN